MVSTIDKGDNDESVDPLMDLLSSPTGIPQPARRNTNTNTAEARVQRIKWPSANHKQEWEHLDNDLQPILENELSVDVNRKILASTTLTYSVAIERFGVIEKRSKRQPPQPTRRQRQIAECRKNLRQVKKQFRTAVEEERLGLQLLRDIERNHLITLRQAESLLRRRKAKMKTRTILTATLLGSVENVREAEQ